MRRCILIISLLIILTGCWDQRFLKEHSLILAIGYDLTDDGRIMKTVSFPNNNGGGQQGMSQKSEIITVVAKTVKDAEIKSDEYSPEKFDRSKAKVLLIGKKLAESGVFPTLDSVYRDLRAPLYASVAIVDGTAKEALNIEETYSLLTSDFYSQLILTASEAGIIKNDNIQELCPIILSDGKDVTVPYMKLFDDGKRAKIDGGSLFNGDKLSGHMTLDENIMLLTLMGEGNKNRKMNFKVTDDDEREEKNHVNFSIRNEKQNIKIIHKEDQITAYVNIDLQIEIDEYASDHLYEEKKARKLTEEIHKQLEKRAKKTIDIIQDANSDALGIGERVKAYHPALWKTVNWKETYADVEIIPQFKVEIIRHGILN